MSFLSDNKLLCDNKHGFRPLRSSIQIFLIKEEINEKNIPPGFQIQHISLLLHKVTVTIFLRIKFKFNVNIISILQALKE